MKKKSGLPPSEWEELLAFLQAEPRLPPESVSRGLLKSIQNKMRPSFSKIFSKFVGVHGVMGSLTLLVCPQLGVGPDWALDLFSPVLMRFGPLFCAAACGSFFLSTSTLVGTLLLRPEELSLAREKGLAHVSLLATLSLVLIMLLGRSDEEQAVYLAWLLGASLTSFATLQGVFFARVSLRRWALR